MSVPDRLRAVVEDFGGAPEETRLPLLLEYSKGLPPLLERLEDHREAMERVHECQTPFFVTREVGVGDRVTFHFDAPPEAPTTRGFAGVLSEGLSGARVDEVLSVPDDFYVRVGLAEVVSPIRLRGMTAILRRIKRQLRERAGETETGGTE